MNIAEKNQKAIWLQMNHKLQPSFSIRAGTGSYNCILIHTQTGEHRFRGVGNSEVEAFANAFSKFEAAPAPADAIKVQQENEDLREQLKAMESKLEDPTPDAVEEIDSDGSTPDLPGDMTPAPKKKTRRKKKSSTTPF